jgi:hypothetical protein
MRRVPKPIPVAGSQLGEDRHLCAFFRGDDEAYRVLLPFILEGFACGDKAVHVVRPDQEAPHLGRLTAAGLDPAAVRTSGQLELRHNTETYLNNGGFDPDRMLAAFESMASGNAKSGFPSSRIICNMDWAECDRSHQEHLVEFESRVNEVWRRHDDTVICVYDLAKFNGNMVIDVMRTHPWVLIGDVLQQNPFFVPPEQFLHELRARRVGHGSWS